MEGSKRDLLDLIQGVTTGLRKVDASSFRTILQKCTPAFLDILKSKGPNAAAKQEIEAGNPATPEGHIRLDPGEVQEVLLLSSEFQLDEMDALLYMLAAHNERGEVSVELAAGIYFEERKASLLALHRLLQVQALGLAEVPDDIYTTVCAYNRQLLGQEADGGCVLLQRLLQVAQDTTAAGKSDTRVPAVVDQQGRELPRHLLLQLEHTLLCECMLYAARIRQHFTARDVVGTAELLHMLSLRLKGSDSGDLTTAQQANTVLAALLQMLAGGEGEGEGEAAARLAKSGDAAAKLEGPRPTEDPYLGPVRLAWGLLLADHGPPNLRARAEASVRQALRGGALRFLHAGLLASPAFEDEPAPQRELVAAIIHRLAVDFLDSEPGREAVETLCAESTAPPQQGDRPAPDGMQDLLLLLAGVYTAHPDLWLDEALRYEVVGEFMGGLGGHPVLGEAVAVLEAYLAVLRALAVTEQGARAMFAQLHGAAPRMLSWRRMLTAMQQYCEHYSAQPGLQEGGSGAGGGGELIVPDADARGLAAYLAVFARVFADAAAADVERWTAELESLVGVRPLWHLFFQLMCQPVPQKLKAALDDALAAFAQRPENVPALWERLLRCVVVRARGTVATGGLLPSADLTYQLNEIEARAEDYSETLAFVRLLNTLLAATPGGPPGGGRQYAHLAEFVRVDVLGQLSQRGYRDERQKWALMEACLHHLRLWLDALDPSSAAAPEPLAVPGVMVAVDLLGERQAMKAVLQLVLRGTDAAAADRKDSAAGAAEEAALLAALRLLRACMQVDEAVVRALRASHENVYLETLDRVLRRQPVRLALLLDFVRYPHHPLVQAEAVRLAHFLSARTPDLVDLLLSAQLPGGRRADFGIAAGYAACLQDSLFASTDGVQEDERAQLVLQLLLHAAEQSTPSLAHLLMGFHVEDGPDGVARSILRPLQSFSCLSVVLAAAQSPALPAARPALYEGLLELLYLLAAAPDSGPPTLDLLREVAVLAAQLDPVAGAPLPSDADARAACLQQRAWLLRLLALEMHHADAALPSHRASLQLLLRELFAAPAGAGGGQELPRWAQALDSLSHQAGPPEFAAEDSRLRRFHLGLELDALLASQQTVQEGGVRTVSRRGHLAYDLPALSAALRSRYQEAEQDARRFGAGGAGAQADLAAACKAALRHAQARNAWVEEAQAQAAALAAWQALVEMAVSRRFDLLDALVPALHAEGLLDTASADQVCGRVLADALSLALSFARGASARLVPSLVQLAATLLARLQQRAAAGVAAGPSTPGFGLPARLHETLRALLAVLAAAGEQAEVRLPAYGALLAYLSVCRGSGAASLPQPVLAALLEGSAAGDVGQAVADMDNLAADVEAGNRELLGREPRLVQLLAGDAVGLTSQPLAKTLALALLKAMVTADGGGRLLAEVQRAGLAERVLQDLVDTPHSALLRAGGKALAAVQVALAQAGLLLEVTRVGLGRRVDASQLHLAGLTVLRKLRDCQLLDLQPEAPGLETSVAGETLRARLGRLLPPLLRLVVAVVAGLPGSRQVKQAGAAFAEAHHRCLVRLLEEAGSPAIRGWSPGAPEFEQATLVVQLLARLQECQASMPVAWPQLRARAFALLLRLGTPSAKSLLPAVRRVSEQLDAGAPADEASRGLAGSVFGLRAALLHFVRGATLQPIAPLVLRVLAGEPGSAAASLPSLLLLADMLKQAAEDLYTVLESQARQLHGLRNQASMALLPADAGAEGRKLAAGRLAVARAAAVGSSQIEALHYLAENLLATVCHHLQQHRAEIGTAQDVEQLRRVMAPSLGLLDQMAAGSALGDSAGASLQQLISRTKDSLVRG